MRARRGYYAPLEGQVAQGPAAQRDPVIGHALDSPFEIPDVPLRVSSFVFDEVALEQMSVQLAVEIDVRGLAFKQEADRSTDALAFLIEAQHRETGEYYRYDQKIEMALLPETRRKLERSGYPVTREFTLPAGGYQAKIVVRDLNSGRVGSVVHEFEVPKAGTLRVSTPVLSDTLEQGADGLAAARPAGAAHLRDRLDALLPVLASTGRRRRRTGSLMPRVTAGYEIRRTDGAVFKRSAPTPINPTSVGALLRLNGIALRGAVAGRVRARPDREGRARAATRSRSGSRSRSCPGHPSGADPAAARGVSKASPAEPRVILPPSTRRGPRAIVKNVRSRAAASPAVTTAETS